MRPSAKPETKKIPNPYGGASETLIPWVRGIVLLRQLKEKGVIVHDNMVRRVCRQRLAVLFGRYRRSDREINRMLRESNPCTLDEVLADLDKAWGTSLFEGFEGDRYGL